MGHPHDAAFKRIFGHPALAADLMRRRIPAAALAELDLDRCAPVTAEFVDRGLRNRRADLVFRIPFAAEAERSAFVFVLIEHQSTPDPLMALRVLAYAVEVWTRHIEAGRTAQRRKPRRLPAVIPLVVHQGRAPWTGPRNLQTLIELPAGLSDALGPHVPRLELLIDDLAVPDDARTGATRLALTAAAILAMRYVRRERDPPGFLQRLRVLLEASVGEPGRRGIIEAVVQYVYDEADRLSPTALLQTIEQTDDPETREVFVSLSDQIREEGRRHGIEQGLERGIEQGIEQGIERGRAGLVLDLVRRRLGEPGPALTARITADAGRNAGAWLERILAASTLSDLEDPAG